ncbi:AAA family ATPase [Alicyclobacillus fodiniaquatilis]|uniref:Nuclease SbcCD subunit C n=1 Tax=Alicyclobacillus fodiniaquatilis TaxID=1661150 RepID=A0ABW4JC13_9BACL
MRPVRLMIAGLHSFRERQEIDFTALTEMGMFGIFGPTGSGKSTILDAITLALYGDVGRAGRNTQAILNHAEKRLEVTFEFDIGAADRRKRYRVERVYKRGNGFSVEHQASRLLQLEVLDASEDYGLVVVADSKNTVNQAVRSILGLEESDFTRAVVLPQGKFAEFLQLTGSERNAMTERLFGLERYGKSLIDKVSARAKQVASEHAQISAGQAELGDASDAAVQAAEIAMQEAEAQLQHADRARKEALTRLQEAEQVRKLMAAREEAQKARDALALRSQEMAVLRRSLDRSAQAHAVWPSVEAWREAQRAVNQAREGVEVSTAALQQARTTLTAADTQLTDAEQRRASMEPELTQKQVRLLDAKALEKQLLASKETLTKVETAHQMAVSQHETARASLEEIAREVGQFARDKDDAEAQLTKHSTAPEVRQRLGEARKALDTWTERRRAEARALKQDEARALKQQTAEELVLQGRAALLELQQGDKTLAQQLAELEARSPVFTAEDLQAQRNWAAQVQLRVDGLCAAEQALADVAQRSEQAHETYEKQVETTKALREETARKEQVWRDLEAERMRRATLSESALIAQLTARLQSGLPCPVCGSLDHPHPAQVLDGHEDMGHHQWSADDDAALAQAEEAWRQAEAASRQMDTVCAQQQTAAQLLDQELEREQQHHASMAQALAACWPPQGKQMLDVSVMPQRGEAWQAFLASLRAAFTEAERALQIWETEQQRMLERKVAQQHQIQQAEQALALAQAGAEAAAQEASRQREAVAEAAADRQTAETALVQVLAALELTDASANALNDATVAAVQARLERLDDDDRLANEARRLSLAINAELTQAQSRLREAEGQAQRAEVALREQAVRLQQLRDDVLRSQTQLDHITGGITVAEALRQVERSLGQLREMCEHAQTARQAAADEVETARQAATRAEAELQLQMRRGETAERQLTDALANAAFATVEAVADALLDEEEAAAYATTLAEYEESARQWTQRCTDLARQLNGRSVDDAAWNVVRAASDEAEANFAAASETSGSTKTQLQDILRRRQRWLALEQARVALTALLTRLSALQSSLRGNSFVQYVARAQMDRVARQASDWLAGLTHGRYALTLTEDGSFLMRDDHNGGALRPVSTLSGGETFLTSLSLALALSAHIQLRGQHPLEFFFLDEGFGTLDPDLLDVVISALEKLHLSRLSIGLISHVPELRQRMHRRLVVEPAVPAGRGTKVSLELA